MRIEPLHQDDITFFLKLAAEENWVAEAWELEFLLSSFGQGCYAARTDAGETTGVVTSLRHDRSAWIGNLIVSPAQRGKGIGEALFKTALEGLQNSGVDTVWLTASNAGMPLYQKFGFTRIDTIIRWSGSGRKRRDSQETEKLTDTLDGELADLDGKAWGDLRENLLSVTAERGTVIRQKSGFAVVQPGRDAWQLGPFSAPGYSSADALLKSALLAIPNGAPVCLDMPAANRTACLLYARNRMRICGSNELMYAGGVPQYRPELIYGLATMGSCG
jgi:GNAT superfamily N-acetyltransferase